MSLSECCGKEQPQVFTSPWITRESKGKKIQRRARIHILIQGYNSSNLENSLF